MDDLLTRCLQGDPDARNQFAERYVAVIYSAVRRVLGARLRDDPLATVEDLTQEVFVRLFRADARQLRAYDPARASLATWLTIVARSTALDGLRKKRLPTVPLDAAAHSPATAAPPPSPQNPAAAPTASADHGKNGAPLAGIKIPPDLLSPRQRLVLQLLYDKELSVTKVAQILGIEEQTVRSTKHKAVNKLRDFFQKSEKV